MPYVYNPETGEFEQQIEITFGVSQSNLNIGESATLRWHVAGAQNVYLEYDGTRERVDMIGRKRIRPQRDTKYKIIALSVGGLREEREITIHVNLPDIPEISFEASEQSLIEGGEVTLNWHIRYAESAIMKFNDFEGSICLDDTWTTSPQATTTYTIIAKSLKSSKVKEQQVTVIVFSAPIIQFTSSETLLEKGETAQLIWNIQFAQSATLEINGESENISSEGQKTIVPERIGDYVCKINVVGLDHKIENHRQLKISVVPTKPYISFTSSNHSLLRGESVQLRWNVQHAQSAMLEIDGQAQDVPLSSSKTVYPQQTTAYKIAAKSLKYNRINEKQVTIEVIPVPVIQLSASTTEFEKGETAQLTWSVEDAQKAQLIYDDVTKDIDMAGTMTVSPRQATTYCIETEYLYKGEIKKCEKEITLSVKIPEPIDCATKDGWKFTAEGLLKSQKDDFCQYIDSVLKDRKELQRRLEMPYLEKPSLEEGCGAFLAILAAIPSLGIFLVYLGEWWDEVKNLFDFIDFLISAAMLAFCIIVILFLIMHIPFVVQMLFFERRIKKTKTKLNRIVKKRLANHPEYKDVTVSFHSNNKQS